MIQHGIPNHKFFYIVQPDVGTPYGERVQLDPKFEKPVIELQDPNTGAVAKAQVWDVLKVHTKQVPNHMFRVTYGVSAEKAISMLEEKYPTIKSTGKIEFLLLKKL